MLRVFGLMIALYITDASDLLASKKYCGYQHSDDYNRDNDNINIDEFPWIAQLLYDEDKTIKCAGSLINNRYVLTAAHCIDVLNTFLSAVRLGDFNITSDKDCIKHTEFDEECSDPVQEFDIETTILHPNYHRRNASNDIGLVRLSRAVEYSEYIRPICLPSSTTFELKAGDQLATSGWGRMYFAGDPTEIKKKVITTLVSLTKCKDIYKADRKPITDSHLCASESSTYTCQGDSGAPLMHSIRNQWVQVGLLSFGKFCGSQFPSVYINVLDYMDWIKENLHK